MSKQRNSVAVEPQQRFAIILREFLATGAAIVGTVGAARAELIDAAGIVEFGASWMTVNLR